MNFFRRSGKDKNHVKEEEEKKAEEVVNEEAVHKPSSSLTNSSSSSATAAASSRRSVVYQEAMEMLFGALFIYIFAEVREIAREKDELAMLEPPLTGAVVADHIKQNAAALKERAIDHEEFAKRLEAFHQVQEKSKQDSFLASLFKMATGSSSSSLSQSASSSSPLLTHFDDRKSDQEIVHAIVVNPARKRISIVFRGSVTQKDFIQDAKCAQKKVDNPAFHLFENPEHTTEGIRIHTGFYEYLMKIDPDTEMTRLANILSQAKDLLQEHKGFQLFLSGHSLGGALCTLTGFYAAADDELIALTNGKPVVVYSFASPYCGNWKFRHSFMHLERLGRLQHLRTANAEDMVTLLPFFTPKVTALSPLASAFQGAGNLYRHVGLRLQLKVSSSSESRGENDDDADDDDDAVDEVQSCLVYPRDGQSLSSEDEYAKEVRDSLSAGKSLAMAFYYIVTKDFEKVQKYHSCDEYEKRLEMCKDELAKVTLTDLYADRSIVGDVLDRDYEPVLMPNGVERAKWALNFWTTKKPAPASSSSKNEDGSDIKT